MSLKSLVRRDAAVSGSDGVPTLPLLDELPVRVSVEELIVIVEDLSGSMASDGASGEPKWKEAATHLFDPDGLIELLRGSSRGRRQWVATLGFDEHVTICHPRPLDQADPTELRIDIAQHGGNTDLGGALEEARIVGREWAAAGTPDIPRRVIVLLFSDGKQTVAGLAPPAVADALKAEPGQVPGAGLFKICTAGYGKDADINTLREMASQGLSGPLFAVVSSGRELKEFFFASYSALAAV